MKLPISKRLLLCAEMVPPCNTVADVGTDHGYLGIHLLQSGRCARVIAADLREKPLKSAKANAAAFGITTAGAAVGRPPEAAGMTFVQSDGLHNIQPQSFDVLVLAGMGGDLITRILADAPWLEGGPYTLILQPQSAANDLRRRLGERAWSIDRERLVRDGRFLYAVMSVRPGQGRLLTPGEQYVSPALRRENDPLYSQYLARVRRALELTVSGIAQSADPTDAARASYYRAALDEITALGYAPEPSPSGEGGTSAHTGDG
jgi:tRNA (adenine22-N1)-methyltransferase